MRKLLNSMTTLSLSLLMLVTITNAQSIPAGNDYWETDNSTYDDVDLPAGAIAPGSDAYSGRVYLKGNPEPGSSYDTNIRRNNSVTPPGNTSLKVVELRMISVTPLQVSFNNGSEVRACDMFVEVSPSQASTGSMSINSGTYSSNLNVIPQLTFTCISGAGLAETKTTQVLDTGSPMIQSFMKQQAADARKRIKAGLATEKDVAKAQACAEPVPTNTATRTPQQAGCGIKFSSNGNWGVCNGAFCITDPLTQELALLASHFVRWIQLTTTTQQPRLKTVP